MAQMNNCDFRGNSGESKHGGNQLFSPFWKKDHFLIIADVPALAAYVHSYGPEPKRAFTLGECNLSFFLWHWNRW